MFTESLTVGFGKYSVHMNSSHIQVREVKTKNVVFLRVPEKGLWYDVKHQAIVDAQAALEKAILAAIGDPDA